MPGGCEAAGTVLSWICKIYPDTESAHVLAKESLLNPCKCNPSNPMFG
jgi:hypothetical protein